MNGDRFQQPATGQEHGLPVTEAALRTGGTAARKERRAQERRAAKTLRKEATR